MCSGPSASVGEWIQDPPSDTTLEGGSSSFRSASMEQRINCILFLFCTVIAEWQLKWLNMCFYIMYLGGSYKSNKLNVIVVIPHKTKVSRGFGGCLLTLLRFSGVPTVTAKPSALIITTMRDTSHWTEGEISQRRSFRLTCCTTWLLCVFAVCCPRPLTQMAVSLDWLCISLSSQYVDIIPCGC